MAHFAQIDENNIVTQVIVVDNSILLDENNEESEALGIAFCKFLLGEDTNWVQTSFNGNFRARYAGIGFTYDEIYDAFIPQKPFENWIFDESELTWIPPIPRPEIGTWIWNQEENEWQEIIIDEE